MDTILQGINTIIQFLNWVIKEAGEILKGLGMIIGFIKNNWSAVTYYPANMQPLLETIALGTISIIVVLWVIDRQ